MIRSASARRFVASSPSRSASRSRKSPSTPTGIFFFQRFEDPNICYWHDIGHYENNIEKKWLDGFEVTRRRWPEVLQQVRRYDAPGKFVPIAGFEWHSTSLGDYHILFPGLEQTVFQS